MSDFCFTVIQEAILGGIQDGRNLGHARGFTEGMAKGCVDGHAEGFSQGRVQGRIDGLAEGLNRGYTDGLSEGLAKGRAEGLSESLAIARAKAVAKALTDHHFENRCNDQAGEDENERVYVKDASGEEHSAIHRENKLWIGKMSFTVRTFAENFGPVGVSWDTVYIKNRHGCEVPFTKLPYDL